VTTAKKRSSRGELVHPATALCCRRISWCVCYPRCHTMTGFRGDMFTIHTRQNQSHGLKHAPRHDCWRPCVRRGLQLQGRSGTACGCSILHVCPTLSTTPCKLLEAYTCQFWKAAWCGNGSGKAKPAMLLRSQSCSGCMPSNFTDGLSALRRAQRPTSSTPLLFFALLQDGTLNVEVIPPWESTSQTGNSGKRRRNGMSCISIPLAATW
jgi:hypothetical protein